MAEMLMKLLLKQKQACTTIKKLKAAWCYLLIPTPLTGLFYEPIISATIVFTAIKKQKSKKKDSRWLRGDVEDVKKSRTLKLCNVP